MSAISTVTCCMTADAGYLSQVSPIELHSFDVEAQGWADSGDVFVVQAFDYSCLASIVQAPVCIYGMHYICLVSPKWPRHRILTP